MLGGGTTTLILLLNKVTLSESSGIAGLRQSYSALAQRFEVLSGTEVSGMTKLEIVGIVERSQLIDIGWLGLHFALPFGLDPNIFGIQVSAIAFGLVSIVFRRRT